MVIQARAQVEQRAMQMLGTVRKWGGGKKVGDRVQGTGRGDDVTSNWWPAVGPATLPAGMEGQVRIMSYSIGAIGSEVSSNWKQVHEHELVSRLIGYVTLTVEPA